jgi:hydroxymethylglutaryl-CoA reductase
MKNSQKIIEEFSKFDREQKITALSQMIKGDITHIHWLEKLWFHHNPADFNMDTISENVISQFCLPYSIAPNFKINDNVYFIPMVTDESSVVAAASSAAKFWMHRGGFHTRVISTTKIGQIHFTWHGKYQNLINQFSAIKDNLIKSVTYFLSNMAKRGGGVKDVELLNFTGQLPDYYQIRVSFETADAMGANLINSCLEEMARSLQLFISHNFEKDERSCDIIMAILSNHTPDCLVECSVQCKADQFKIIAGDLTPQAFVGKFKYAVDIANIDIYRAATHNKGIFNGIDAVVLATGNDYRAIEAGGHSYAVKDGQYKSLTSLEIDNDNFTYTLRIPLAIGTVGGLTSIHPLAKLSLEIMGNPDAEKLMQISAAAGLANNFSAIRALITTGIQKGHMKLHLNNILNFMKASEIETKQAVHYFTERTVSYAAVQSFVDDMRKQSKA